MKTNRHSLMAKGILVLLSLLILLFAFSFSWYKAVPTADTKGLDAHVSSNGDFDFALGFSNSQTVDTYKYTGWYSGSDVNLDLTHIGITEPGDSNPTYYNLLIDYSPIDLTGNGATLVRPAMMSGNKEIDRSTTTYSESVPNSQYITFDMVFRSKSSDTSIYLDQNSFALGGSEIKTNKKADVSTSASGALSNSAAAGSAFGFNASTYGRTSESASDSTSLVSKDAIVGAVRVAFVGFDDDNLTFEAQPTGSASPSQKSIWTNNDVYKNTDVPNLLWIPRPNLKLNPHQTDGSDDMWGWTLSYPASGNTYSHTYYNPLTQSDVNYTGAVTAPAATSSDKIVDISHQSDGYYYAKVKVVIWIEGCDTEARRATSGGRFDVYFDFHGSNQ